MERTFEIRTDGNVAFSYELAGLGSRFLAVMIDTALQLLIALALLLLLAGLRGPVTHAVRALHLPVETEAVLSAAVVGLLFVVGVGYFTVFETWWQGRTPGKRALGIRVVRDGGYPLDFMSAVVRNVVRLLEFAAAFYAVSAVTVLCSPANKRLGDYAAGTIVVRDRRTVLPPPAASALTPGRAPAGDLQPADYALIVDYLARCPALEPGARARIAGRIAVEMRPKLYASFAHLDDEALIELLGETVPR